MRRIHKYSEKTNVSTGRPKTELLLEGSRKRFGSELHVDGPATAITRPPCKNKIIESYQPTNTKKLLILGNLSDLH